MNIDERDKENNDQTESLEDGLRYCEQRGSGAVLGDHKEVQEEQEEKDPRFFFHFDFEALPPPVPPGGTSLAGSVLVVRPITAYPLCSRFSFLLSDKF